MTCLRRTVFAVVTLALSACCGPVDNATNHDLAHATLLVSGVAVQARTIERQPEFFTFTVAQGASFRVALANRNHTEPTEVVVTLSDPNGTTVLETARSACPTCDPPRVSDCRNYSYTGVSGYSFDCTARVTGAYVVRVDQYRIDNICPFVWDYAVTVTY